MRSSTRKIHVVDVENLCADARPSAGLVRRVRDCYTTEVGPGAEDLVVLACNHGAALEVGLGWPGTRLIVRSGPDGADRALLDVLADENIEGRFAGVVIASGDGIFTDAAARLAGEGVSVLVVSRVKALSKRLRLAAKSVLVFPWPETDAEVA